MRLKLNLLTKISETLRSIADTLTPQKPARVPVESSMIKSIGWHDGTLEVEFNSGKVYQYADVSKSTHTRLMAADSIGRYFNAHIRDEYDYQAIN